MSSGELKMKPIEIISITSEDIVVRYNIPDAKKLIYTVFSEKKEIISREISFPISPGRFRIAPLTPQMNYTLHITQDKKTVKIDFATLENPLGKCSCKYGVLGDLHLSEKKSEFGRMHEKSVSIVRGIVDTLNGQDLDFVLIVGDIVDAALTNEYDMAQRELSRLNCPILAIPGNHDMKWEDPVTTDLWRSYWGDLSWYKRMKAIDICGLDTHNRSFLKANNIAVLKNINPDNLFIILSHYQLKKDDGILDTDSAVFDMEEFNTVFDTYKKLRGIIYVGHKNVPSQTNIGNVLQVSVPQPTHFPCGYLLAKCYKNGIYHKFMPACEEKLNVSSAEGLSAVGTSIADTFYRESGITQKWSFIYKT